MDLLVYGREALRHQSPRGGRVCDSVQGLALISTGILRKYMGVIDVVASGAIDDNAAYCTAHTADVVKIHVRPYTVLPLCCCTC